MATALDTSLLRDHLGSYVFHGPDAPSIDQHLVWGISLGGHAAWQVIMSEPRVTAAVVIIGGPDYMSRCILSTSPELCLCEGDDKSYSLLLCTKTQRRLKKLHIFNTRRKS